MRERKDKWMVKVVLQVVHWETGTFSVWTAFGHLGTRYSESVHAQSRKRRVEIRPRSGSLNCAGFAFSS